MTKRRILLVVSGGIAAYKVPELVRTLVKNGHHVRCVVTEAAQRFVAPLALQAVSNAPVRTALFDLGEESQIGHIELADWAELVIVAPMPEHLGEANEEFVVVPPGGEIVMDLFMRGGEPAPQPIGRTEKGA